MSESVLHGCAICGGQVLGQRDNLALQAGSFVAVVESVLVGECENCGERYHPAETSRRLEEVVQQALKARKLTKKALRTLHILSERDFLAGRSVFEKQLLERVERLEQKMAELAHA
jgi:hypothetical protein